MPLPGRIMKKHKEKPRKPLYFIYIMLMYIMFSLQSHATQAKGWLPKGLKNFLWFMKGGEFRFCSKLIMGSFKRIVEIHKNSYGMFRGRTKCGERERSGSINQEQKWTKSTKAVNHVNRLLVQSLVCLSPKLGHSSLPYFLVQSYFYFLCVCTPCYLPAHVHECQ